jgi:hypothetical protein
MPRLLLAPEADFKPNAVATNNRLKLSWFDPFGIKPGANVIHGLTEVIRTDYRGSGHWRSFTLFQGAAVNVAILLDGLMAVKVSLIHKA